MLPSPPASLMAFFVDFLGSAEAFRLVSRPVAEEVAQALRCPVEQVRVRRLVTDEDAAHAYIELWVELSSDEQLYRIGGPLASAVADRVRSQLPQTDVWLMYRVVPRSHAFLNGAPRGRGTASFE